MLDYNILCDRIYKFLGRTVNVELATCSYDNSAIIKLHDLKFIETNELLNLIHKTNFKIIAYVGGDTTIYCRNNMEIVEILEDAIKPMMDYSDISKFIVNERKKSNKYDFKAGPIKIDYQDVFPAIPDRIDKIYVDEKKKTIAVKWKDGDVTKVKLRKGDKFDIETGAALAILKKVTFPHHHLQKVIEKNLVFVDKKNNKKPEIKSYISNMTCSG